MLVFMNIVLKIFNKHFRDVCRFNDAHVQDKSLGKSVFEKILTHESELPILK